MAPTPGGHHHWVAELAPSAWQRSLSYTAGWLACIAWQSISATDCDVIAEVIQALMTINNPEYLPTRWAGTLLTILTAMVLSAFNMFAVRHVSVSEGVFMTCHVFAFVPIFVTLWVMVDPKTSVTEAFVHFRDNGGGWPTPTLSAFVGQVACIYATSGVDSVIHLADEVENAALTVPRGMVWAFFLNCPMALIILVTYCMNVGDLSQALNGRYPPFVAVFANALQSRGALLAFTTVILALLVMVTISALAATSRQTFAFARDKGLPFSHDLSHVSGSCHVPATAIFATACVTSVLALLQLGSKTTTKATLSLACAALNTTSALTLATLLHRRRRFPRLPRARWSLGRFGAPINTCALLYTLWAIFWSFWPSEYHVSVSTFNWTPVILSVTMGYAALVYHCDGKQRYRAPVMKEEVDW